MALETDSKITHAFILGAGLGTRLRPLTESLPKPLVPVWNAPLITYAMDHLIHDLGVSEIMINTHHAAEAYSTAFPDQSYRDCSLHFRHETELLDTAGGLDNIRDWLPEDEDFIVYNGDILTDLPLDLAVDAHKKSGNLVTLILRDGDGGNVAFDPAEGKVLDMRGALGVESDKLYQFTGVYIVSPEFLDYLKPGEIESVVLPMLEVISKENKLGGVLLNEGHWSDLGDIDSYLDALVLMNGGTFPSYGLTPEKTRIHPDALVDPESEIDDYSSVGANARVGEGAILKQSVVWDGAYVEPGKVLDREVVK